MVPPKSKVAGLKIGDWANSSVGTLLGAVKQALSATVGLKIVTPGAVVIIPVWGFTLTATVFVLMISGTTLVGTLTLPGLLNGSRPTITPLWS